MREAKAAKDRKKVGVWFRMKEKLMRKTIVQRNIRKYFDEE